MKHVESKLFNQNGHFYFSFQIYIYNKYIINNVIISSSWCAGTICGIGADTGQSFPMTIPERPHLGNWSNKLVYQSLTWLGL